MPETAEEILARGDADMVSMARPFLADADWVQKAAGGRSDEINTCIGCNQACLDHTFAHKIASCLVNPRAAHETELVLAPTRRSKRIAVVGAGPAGLAVATTAAARGHSVDLFEAADEIGGQFNLARRIPGKEEFAETIRYFTRQLELSGVKLHLNHAVDGGRTGCTAGTTTSSSPPASRRGPRPSKGSIGRTCTPTPTSSPVARMSAQRVAVIGAGGIGFDVSEFLTHPGEHGVAQDRDSWMREWGVADPAAHRGGLAVAAPDSPLVRSCLLQRKAVTARAGLGKTSGWVHRAVLKTRGVEMINGVNYERIDDDGLHISFGAKHERARVLDVDDVVICAGQEPRRELADALATAGRAVHLSAEPTSRSNSTRSGRSTRAPAWPRAL